jgi:hypothetical protein
MLIKLDVCIITMTMIVLREQCTKLKRNIWNIKHLLLNDIFVCLLSDTIAKTAVTMVTLVIWRTIFMILPSAINIKPILRNKKCPPCQFWGTRWTINISIFLFALIPAPHSACSAAYVAAPPMLQRRLCCSAAYVAAPPMLHWWNTYFTSR